MERLGRTRTGDTGRAGKQLLAVVDEDGMITLLPPDWTRNTVVGTVSKRHKGGWLTAPAPAPAHTSKPRPPRVCHLPSKTDGMQQQTQWQGHMNAIFDVAWRCDDRRIVTASGDQSARLWDIETRQFDLFEGHRCSVKAVSAHPTDPRTWSARRPRGPSRPASNRARCMHRRHVLQTCT